MAKGGRFPMGGMGGMGNMSSMIKQAQKMQQDMLKMQEEMEQTCYEASSGGGAVTVKMSGKKELQEIKLKPEVVDPDDIEMLEDLILVAVNDAMKKVDDENQSQMSKLTGGMSIPGLF
ncbi:MAG: YbaB/EbfC family nucleoid-associated protein [Ruminococcaceae bacterium]|nr:YbaB/EbfC family nucleoid-associated protein [Oscillospiraceae bacterium]